MQQNYPVEFGDIIAVDDTYTEQFSNTTDTNYGDKESLVLKHLDVDGGLSRYTRDIYLKFPLEGLTLQDFEKAEVVMVFESESISGTSEPDVEQLNLSLLYSNDWSEETLTFNSAPDSNSDFINQSFLDVTQGPNQEVTWNITDTIEYAISQGWKYISFKVASLDNGGNGRYMTFYSKESGVNGPVLRINNAN